MYASIHIFTHHTHTPRIIIIFEKKNHLTGGSIYLTHGLGLVYGQLASTKQKPLGGRAQHRETAHFMRDTSKQRTASRPVAMGFPVLQLLFHLGQAHPQLLSLSGNTVTPETSFSNLLGIS